MLNRKNLQKILRRKGVLPTIFSALHGMQMRSSDEKAFCLSVCPSVKRVHCDKTE